MTLSIQADSIACTGLVTFELGTVQSTKRACTFTVRLTSVCLTLADTLSITVVRTVALAVALFSHPAILACALACVIARAVGSTVQATLFTSLASKRGLALAGRLVIAATDTLTTAITASFALTCNVAVGTTPFAVTFAATSRQTHTMATTVGHTLTAVLTTPWCFTLTDRVGLCISHTLTTAFAVVQTVTFAVTVRSEPAIIALADVVEAVTMEATSLGTESIATVCTSEWR